MKTKLKKVYYCDFCKKYGLRKLTKHELHCTANPNRECRMYGCSNPSLPELIEKYKNQLEVLEEPSEFGITVTVVKVPELEDIRDDVSGCPNCMLTVVRCAGLNQFIHSFDYFKEREQWWAAINEDAQRTDECSSMYG